MNAKRYALLNPVTGRFFAGEHGASNIDDAFFFRSLDGVERVLDLHPEFSSLIDVSIEFYGTSLENEYKKEMGIKE